MMHITTGSGWTKFMASYRYLKRMRFQRDTPDDDAAATDELQRLIGGTEQLLHLPVLLQLISVEGKLCSES